MKKTIRYGLAILISAAVLCLVYGFFIEPKRLVVTKAKITSPNWTGASIKIGLITDIHIGGLHIPPRRVESLVARMNEQGVDIILLPGDFINGHIKRENHSDEFNAEVKTGLAHLKKLEAPLGIYASLGNHDAWYDAAYVKTQLDLQNFTVLDNEAAYPVEDLCIIGLADHYTGRPDGKAFEKCQAQQNIITFMHSPDSFLKVPRRAALALAGHTHGGQIVLPFIGRRVTSTLAGRKWAYGLINLQGVPAFVSAGVGTSVLPARFRAPPEIVVLDLSTLP